MRDPCFLNITKREGERKKEKQEKDVESIQKGGQ